jgi:protein disulfide-isomerase
MVLGLIAAVCQPACALEWLTDLPTALARAQKENKAVLLDFTGSDWCGWCQKLKREVFDQFDFACYANPNLIMVEVDFPRHKSQSLDQINANANLAVKYDIKGYPTIILLNSSGQQIGQTSYVEGGTSAFIAEINKFPGMPHRGQPGTAAPVGAAKSPPNAPSQAAGPAPAIRYGELTLKGISGSGNHRMALINNETLMAGETAKVKTLDTRVEITVKEIRDESVIIAVNGQPRELKLAHP